MEIPVGNLIATIDDEDLEKVQGYHWYPLHRDQLVYAYAHSHMHEGRQVLTTMHSVVLGTKWIDHIDGNGLNNQKSNLRPCTNQQNQANSKKRSGTHSRHKGVSWNKNIKRWQAYINKGGIRYYVGCFKDEDEAGMARDVKALELFGEYARLNFPEGGE